MHVPDRPTHVRRGRGVKALLEEQLDGIPATSLPGLARSR